MQTILTNSKHNEVGSSSQMQNKELVLSGFVYLGLSQAPDRD